MNPPSDIYRFDQKLKIQIKQVRESSISNRNKSLIVEFDNACLLEGLSKPRRIKLINTLLYLARFYLRKDFDKATIKDIKQAVTEIEDRSDYSVWTKHDYKIILKKFYKWFKYGDDHRLRKDYPKIVSWINATIKKKDKPKVRASDILTEEEILRLLKAAEYPRDKAFISMLYELGARISEIGNMTIKDVSKDQYSYLVDISGKTGRRTPRIVISSPYITNWINVHPEKDNPNAPLWILSGKRNKTEKMMYGSIRALVKRLAKRADIKKRVYNHLFRHTRVTHLLINKQISEAQAKVYFGWVPSSNMLSEYSHLVSSDVNDAILEIHGIKKPEDRESKLKPKQCSTCNTINSKDALFCQKCGHILEVKTAIEIEEQRQGYDDMVGGFLKDKKTQDMFVEWAKRSGNWDKLKELVVSRKGSE